MKRIIKPRFVLLSWMLMLLFLVALCAGISTYMYQTETRKTERALKQAIEIQHLNDDTRGMILVVLDRNGKIIRTEQHHLNLDEDTVLKLAEQVNRDEKQHVEKIEIDNQDYRYLAVQYNGGRLAAASTCAQELDLAKRLKNNSVLFILIGMVLLLPVSLMLTMWVSKPMQRAFEQQENFVSDATHELKTPLTVIAANTEAVLSNPESEIETQEKYLVSIRKETTRMSDLVGNLLFLAKVDAGEIHPDTEMINLTEQLEWMCMERESSLFEAEKEMDYEMTPNVQYKGDWKHIKRMLEAILDNAEKNTPEGGKIQIVLNHTQKKQVRIVISNTGEEIKKEDLRRIFDRFYRADPSRARETGGYGLGLSVARSIAEIHNGTITAESGNGINTFTIILGDIAATE